MQAIQLARLRENLGDNAGTNRLAAFANRETNTVVHSDRLLQFDFYLYVIARHAHFCAHQLGRSRNVRCTEVELWAISAEERCMATTFILAQAVDLCFELGVRVIEPGLAKT